MGVGVTKLNTPAPSSGAKFDNSNPAKNNIFEWWDGVWSIKERELQIELTFNNSLSLFLLQFAANSLFISDSLEIQIASTHKWWKQEE
jgi:hypothetical protein